MISWVINHRYRKTDKQEAKNKESNDVRLSFGHIEGAKYVLKNKGSGTAKNLELYPMPNEYGDIPVIRPDSIEALLSENSRTVFVMKLWAEKPYDISISYDLSNGERESSTHSTF